MNEITSPSPSQYAKSSEGTEDEFLGASGSGLLDKMDKIQYDMILPIGRSCHTVMILNRLKLRTKSYPFDWSGTIRPEIAGVGGVRMKIELIENDFKDWFNFKDFVIEGYNNSPHHRVINIHTGLNYFHHFPKEQPIEENFDEVKERYTRRANRLVHDLRKSRRTLCVYMQDTWDQFDPLIVYFPDAQIVEWNERLNKKMGGGIDFIFFEHDPNIADRAKDGQMEFIQLNEHILRVRSDHRIKENDDHLAMIVPIKKVLSHVHLTSYLVESDSDCDQP